MPFGSQLARAALRAGTPLHTNDLMRVAMSTCER
jgi:hypothetical protein